MEWGPPFRMSVFGRIYRWCWHCWVFDRIL